MNLKVYQNFADELEIKEERYSNQHPNLYPVCKNPCKFYYQH